MSSIFVKFLRDKHTFSVTELDLASNYCDIYIGIENDHGSMAEFDNLSFGFDLKKGYEQVFSGKWPAAGSRYVYSDQDFIESVRVNWSPDWELTLNIWLEEAGQRYMCMHTVKVPRPAQPYPSWTWNGSYWQPPVPYPDDGKEYYWDEDKQQWVSAGT